MDIEDRLHPEHLRSHRTMMIKTLSRLCLLLALALAARAQNPAQNQTQQLVFAGLRSLAAQGQFNAVQSDSAGNLYLLLDQKDGVRLLKTDSTATTVLAQSLLGAKGDIGLALALDPAGNVFVAGTTTSTTLTATAGAAVPTRTDSSTNSFLARFDPSTLAPVFVTFTGGSKISATALTATADAVFVTGSLFATNLPVTPSAIQQSPALNTSQNGFVERFNSSGSTLIYATYLTGAGGNTVPAAITADSADDAFIAGSTSASGFPTIAALVPVILSNPSGFLTRLTPGGDGITFSTFIPGPGLTSIALANNQLLLSGSIALGQFPVDTAVAPVIPTQYQILARLPLDGSSVISATVLAPGTQSTLIPAANSSVWLAGTSPLPSAALSEIGQAYALHLTSANLVDQTARFGGIPDPNPGFSSLPTTLTSLTVDPTGAPIFAGSVQPTTSSSLLASETYDLPLRNAPTPALPSTLKASEQTANTCNGSLCAGSAAYLSKLNVTTSAPALSFSVDDAPIVTLRNLGSASAIALQLTTTSGAMTSTCPTTLASGASCTALLTGNSATTLTAAASNTTPQSVAIPAYTAPASTIVFSPKELDFGIQTSASPTEIRTITVSNLGTTSQTFTSAFATISKSTPPFTEISSDCTLSGAVTTKVLAAGGICHITLGLTAPSTPASDALLTAAWTIGTRAVVLTGYSQAASLALSAAEIDFGTQFSGGIRTPRYLYLSNSSTSPQIHRPSTSNPPFTVTDSCPSNLPAQSICRLRIDYAPATTPSKDSATLTLDSGLSVLLTAQSAVQPGTTGQSANPSLTVSPTSVTFPSPVVVTSVSSSGQTVALTNSGSAPFPLSLSLSGDFTDVTSCAATLPAGATCAINLTFAPAQPGPRQGLLSIMTGATYTPVTVALAGTGMPILPASSSGFNFGSALLGTPIVQFYQVSQPLSTLSASTTGPYTVTLVQNTGFGYGHPAPGSYAPSTTGPCPNCFVGIQFLPATSGPQPGTLTLSSTQGGSPFTLPLTGVGLPTTGLLVTPIQQDFGTVPTHSTSGAIPFTVSNLSTSGSSATLTSAVTGDFALTSTSTGAQTCTGSLAYGASCIATVAFTPTATGTRTGTLTIGTTTAALTGFGADDPGIALSPLALTFLNVPGTSATQQTVTLTNTGTASQVIGTATVTTAAFTLANSCGTLAPAASCTVQLTFHPGTSLVADTLTIPTSSSTYTVALSGNYTSTTAGLELVPSASLFAPAATGAQASSRILTLNNLSSKTVAVSLAVPRQFTLVGAPCTSLAPLGSCSFTVAFAPLSNGDLTGTLIATGTPTDGSASLTGIGYLEGFGQGQGTLTLGGALLGTGSMLNFGQVTSGQTASQILTLTNSNPTPLTLRRILSVPPFLTTTTCGSTLPTGQSCDVTISYSPLNQVAAGTASPASTTDTGLLTLESDATSSPDQVNLSGQAGPLPVGSPQNTPPMATYTLSQTAIAFPATAVGNVSPAQIVTLTNTGTVALHVYAAFTTPDFSVENTCTTVLPAVTCTFSVTSIPQTAGSKLSALQISSDSSQSLDFITLVSAGTPSPLVLAPASLQFGAILLGANQVLPVQVTNDNAGPIVFKAVTTTGDFAPSGNCPAPGGTLAAGASCTVQVTFAPTGTGVRSGRLSLSTSSSTNPLTVALTGTGTQSNLILNLISLNFGSVAQGIASNLPVTLTNSGTGPVNALTLATTGDYSITVPCPSATLAPGATCTAQVTFTPTTAGSRPGTLTITSSAPGSPLTVPLAGTGTAAAGSAPTGTFSLTVNNAASAAATVLSGNPATFALAVTPTSGFTGPVALTCAPVTAGLYVSCSFTPATLTLTGASAGTSTVTLNTITNAAQLTGDSVPSRTLLCLLIPGIVLCWRTRRRAPMLFGLVLTGFALVVAGCGGKAAPKTVAAPTTLNTPAGSYQYTVTASSTTGVVLTRTVTLNLTVQ